MVDDSRCLEVCVHYQLFCVLIESLRTHSSFDLCVYVEQSRAGLDRSLDIAGRTCGTERVAAAGLETGCSE